MEEFLKPKDYANINEKDTKAERTIGIWRIKTTKAKGESSNYYHDFVSVR
jgi:hypothetical protein